MRQSAAAASLVSLAAVLCLVTQRSSPQGGALTTASLTLFEFAVLFISFCLMPLAPMRKPQNRNEFAPGKPNKRNRLFPLGCFESNMLWNAKYFRARRLGTFIPGSWRVAARITSLQYFLFALNKCSEKRYPCLPRYPAQV